MSRRSRDALVGLMVALAPFAYKQFVSGNTVLGAVTAVAVGALALLYRYADAQVIEAVGDADAEELRPVLRRVAQWVRRLAGVLRERTRGGIR